eukprot:TRINITY_DN13801_c0_g2_i1.p1 TRINITY_DN13801_c0_g2~~TRINITY_DN13801_c0_g2_i1.p1  ORF type:complete len:225 (+),score=47.34 TRINITY_DN13801_c0_g2_i1:182-856(+)
MEDRVLKRDLKQWLPHLEVTQIKHEEEEHISAIKQGLATALTTHDWYHNGAHYAKALSNFLDLKYTMKYEDWVFIVKVMFNMVVSEGLDFDLQTRWALLLTRFLKRYKKYELEENFEHQKQQHPLILPWRPIYDILVKTYFKNIREAIFVHKEVHGSALVYLAKKSKKFFDISATKEILDELRYDSILFFLSCFFRAIPKWNHHLLFPLHLALNNHHDKTTSKF